MIPSLSFPVAGRRAGLILVVTLLAVVVGCRPSPDTPRGTAERFIDAHYVVIDLPEARAYTSGLAREKIDEEARLTAGQVIDETTRKPRVHYSLVEEKPRGEGVVSLVYDASFQVDGADTLHRKLQLTVRRDAEGWRVTNYQEY